MNMGVAAILVQQVGRAKEVPYLRAVLFERVDVDNPGHCIEALLRQRDLLVEPVFRNLAVRICIREPTMCPGRRSTSQRPIRSKRASRTNTPCIFIKHHAIARESPHRKLQCSIHGAVRDDHHITGDKRWQDCPGRLYGADAPSYQRFFISGRNNYRNVPLRMIAHIPCADVRERALGIFGPGVTLPRTLPRRLARIPCMEAPMEALHGWSDCRRGNASQTIRGGYVMHSGRCEGAPFGLIQTGCVTFTMQQPPEAPRFRTPCTLSRKR